MTCAGCSELGARNSGVVLQNNGFAYKPGVKSKEKFY